MFPWMFMLASSGIFQCHTNNADNNNNTINYDNNDDNNDDNNTIQH